MSSKRQRSSKGKRNHTDKDFEAADAHVDNMVAVESSGTKVITEASSVEVHETLSNVGLSSLSSVDVSWQRVKGTYSPFHADDTEQEGEMVE